MKSITMVTLLTIVFLVNLASAQTKTEEKRTTVDKATGDTVVTEAVIISQSEDITPRNTMLIINPLKFFLFYNLSIMHKVDQKWAIGGGLQFPTPAGVDGFGVNAEARYYPSGKTLRGFYFAPNISYNSLKSGENNETVSLFSVGALVGWQWFPGEEFAIGLGIGADYYSGSSDSDSEGLSNYDGMVPLVRFDIGYAW